jgi:hypothetical protein
MKEQVKAYYESHRLSMAKIARQSESIFGQKVTLDQLKGWSQEDGGWKKSEIAESEKLNIIANRIFEAIEDNEDLPAKDLTALANTFLQITTKAPPESADRKPTLQEIIDAVK